VTASARLVNIANTVPKHTLLLDLPVHFAHTTLVPTVTPYNPRADECRALDHEDFDFKLGF